MTRGLPDPGDPIRVQLHRAGCRLRDHRYKVRNGRGTTKTLAKAIADHQAAVAALLAINGRKRTDGQPVNTSIEKSPPPRPKWYPGPIPDYNWLTDF